MVRFQQADQANGDSDHVDSGKKKRAKYSQARTTN